TYPHFNQDALRHSLSQAGIQYLHCPALAGRRNKQAVDDNLNGAWKNRSFHNYADYALSERFQEAMDRLMSLAAKDTVAIMCAESVWWRCHRRIIADHLMAVGHCVKHIIGERITTAELTKFANVDAQKQVTYPPQYGSLK